MMSLHRTFKGEWFESKLVTSYYPDSMKGITIQEPIPHPISIPEKQKIN